MNAIVPNNSNRGNGSGVPESFSRPEARSLARRQNTEIAHGIVTSSRIQAAGFVAAGAIQMTSMLSREAEFMADGNPSTANRLNFIADSFAEYAAWEVRRMNR